MITQAGSFEPLQSLQNRIQLVEKIKIDRSEYAKFESKTQTFKSELRAIRQLQKVNATSIEKIAKSLHKTAANRMMSLVSSEVSERRRYMSHGRGDNQDLTTLSSHRTNPHTAGAFSKSGTYNQLPTK